MKFEPEYTATVVIDMQNGFCHPEGSLHSEASEKAIGPVSRLVERARDAEASVIYTRDIHTEEQFEGAHHYDEFAMWGEHVLEGTWDAGLVDELEPEEGDPVVEKYTYDAFYRTGLEAHLENHDIEDLLFCGTLANVCVLQTAASAAIRDLRPVVVRDALGYLEEEDRDYALKHVSSVFGESARLEEVRFS